MFGNVQLTAAALGTISLLAGAAAWAQPAEEVMRLPGVALHFYEVGTEFRGLPELVPGQAPSESRVLPTLELMSMPDDAHGPEGWALVEAHGFLTIAHAGHYEFRLHSAGASVLRIGETIVAARDGDSSSSEGSIVLQPGVHPLAVRAAAPPAAAVLSLRWKPPTAATFEVVPPSVLSRPAGELPAAAPGRKQIVQGGESVTLARPPQPPVNTLSDGERAQGWELLFDGRTMEKWRGYGRDDVHEGWAVIDGAITRVGGGGDIITRDQYENFDLYIDWRIAPAGNSGIFYHVREASESGERYGAVWLTGPEMQILDNQGHADRAQASTSAGANYALHAPIGDATRPVGAFNTARILVRGDQVQYWLNGVKVVEFDRGSDDFKQRIAQSKFATMPGFAKYRSGHIALQDHGDLVQFRNIRIRRLE